MSLEIINLDSDSDVAAAAESIDNDDSTPEIVILDIESNATVPAMPKGSENDEIKKPSELPSTSALKISNNQSRSSLETVQKTNQTQSSSTIQKETQNSIELVHAVTVDKSVLKDCLPPYGQLIRRRIKIDDKVLVMKTHKMPWIGAQVHSITSQNPITYLVKLIPKKHNNQLKNIFGRHLAHCSLSSVIIPIATRVIASADGPDSIEPLYYSGIIAEQPKPTNNYRYLIFFDDDCVKYVKHKNIFIISECSPDYLEDIPENVRNFIGEYLKKYPECQMTRLQKNQVLKTRWNEKWHDSIVIQTDASLANIYYPGIGKSEWIYRGSGRFKLVSPNEIKRPSIKELPLDNYIAAAAAETIGVTAPKKYRAVAKKSTSKEQKIESLPGPSRSPSLPPTPAPTPSPPPPPSSPNSLNENNDTNPSHSIVHYKTLNEICPKKFEPHRCSSKCVEHIKYTPDDFKGYSMLSIPLLCGWNRQHCKYNKSQKIIIYEAPCGRRLKNMEELHKYLRKIKSSMSVDLFDFDYWVNCLSEFVLDTCFVNIKDLSYGIENVVIPCVNEIDYSHPDPIRYSTKREPTEGVNLNLDQNFLSCCDCEDDCSDKTKCQCWQLTIQGATFGGRVPNNNVGYVYKRLPEPVSTGVYECNSQCKCSVKTCLNRVVQHPLRQKLQVYKTQTKGWGIRCLNDIPMGSFICIYAGRLLTEQGANEGGKNYGDEYLAELDYVEVVERMKAGYESDVVEPEDDPLSLARRLDESISDNDNKKKGKHESDQEFIIEHYDGESISNVETSKSMTTKLRKRKRDDKIVTYYLDSTDEDDDDDDDNVKIGIFNKKVDKFSQKYDDDDDDEGGNQTVMRKRSKLISTDDCVQIDRPRFKSVLEIYGPNESVYVIDGKTIGNIGRYFNHSCSPNVFVQNVFVDTHDIRFPWVSFFALNFIRAGQELTWNYNYAVNSIPGKSMICHCGASNCQGRLL